MYLDGYTLSAGNGTLGSTIQILDEDGNVDETHIGYDVMPNQNMGPVSIQNGHFQIINRGGVIIKNGFEVKKGAVFEIK